MSATIIAVVAESITFSYRTRLKTVSTSLTFSYNVFATVGEASITSIYFRKDPTAKYIHCAFCTGKNPYRAIDSSFMALHMLECHKSELLRAPVVSHKAISPYYSLEARAIFITELVKQSKYMSAGWLAVRR